MFYFYLTIAYYSFLSLLTQLLLLKIGYAQVLGSTIFNAFITFSFAALALKKFQLNHNQSRLSYAFGALLAVFGLSFVFLRSNYINAFTFCSALLISCMFSSFGIIVMLYNKDAREACCNSNLDTPEEDTRTDLIYGVLFEIDQLLSSKKFKLKNSFANNLIKIAIYIEELNAIDYPISKELLSQLIDLLQTYTMLRESVLPTPNCLETIDKIEESFEKVKVAFYNMYSSDVNKKLEDAQIKAKVIENYMNINGFLPSDFENNKN